MANGSGDDGYGFTTVPPKGKVSSKYKKTHTTQNCRLGIYMSTIFSLISTPKKKSFVNQNVTYYIAALLSTRQVKK